MSWLEHVYVLPLTCYTDPSPQSDKGIDIWYPQGSGKTNIYQMGLWSIMSDRPSYTIHPQPSGVSGSGYMDFCLDRLNRQVPFDEVETPLNFEGIEPNDYLTYQADITAELNINRSYDDLLDVSTNLSRCRPCPTDRSIDRYRVP